MQRNRYKIANKNNKNNAFVKRMPKFHKRYRTIQKSINIESKM